MKTIIGRYREITSEAAEKERAGELAHASKLWRIAEENARSRHNAQQVEFCQRRSAFCDRALWRQKQADRAAKGRS